MLHIRTIFITMSLLAGIFLTSCDKETPVAVVKPNIDFYILQDGNQLKKINAMQSEMASNTVAITGLMANDALTAIDFRPATGELYGVSTMNRIYIINQESGTARVVGAAALNPTINGSAVALDFNPTVDRIRLVTNTGQNLRLHPETGAVAATDGVIAGTMSQVIESVAYSSNMAGASSTILFDIDSKTDKLYKQDPPNNGTLIEVGSLGVDITMSAGFDINPAGDVALTAVKVADKWELHQVNLTTGMLTKLGSLPSGNINGLAIPTSPVAFAVDESTNLLAFNFKNIGTPISKPITGLQAGETILGIDFRPVNGQLYALGSSSRIYVLNTASGAATAVGTMAFSTMLMGTSFGFDFNPTVDRIRCVSNTGQNLRLHPESGVIAATDGALNPGMPMIVASAYTNNFVGTTSTILYNLDANTDKLYKQDPPNNGTQVEVGALGVNIEAASGFDIGSRSGMAYAVLKVADKSSIYSINLTTGMATKMGDLPLGVRAFSVGTGF
ncbi:DUF4394 domain-containing protein [Lacihabitans sp. CCS-44]|uniref:DUF4394 domain-containing protein n=1 Tax=Lacihabitans sp. CCS-44 TaxID=2487331 RepID=UPI0020CD9641|nr:DUF4394 domain-containing protein [Lacihabitans sp. CCS-44]MCP9756485.1 DUF4394 domain-containing protein [Lacihabitans sp. CCS-44]